MNALVALPILTATPTMAADLPPFANELPSSNIREISIVPHAHPDAALLALADEYVVAEKRWCDLNSAVDHLEFDEHRKQMPDVLRRTEADTHLGLPSLVVNDAWDCLANVNRLREERWPVTSRTGPDDDLTLRFRLLPPSAEARARADEIIAAFGAWEAKRYPRGYKKLLRDRNRAFKVYAKIEERIAATPATTTAGMMAKIRCAQAYSKVSDGSGISLECGGCGEKMAGSIFRDIERLATEAA
ncbi:hypothetical protein IVA86_33190 [Bradyrhizobium sp. 146]|uniref:hypothetical protein n=1 Tax=Bradyrhizobium sp. 146 TaxID=2782622 RepID=UPI001FFAF640|nr:hypothetical protein [Bradyrhizobium sp. 146]MCK1706129.1 hypothetical protein [Bradyrhizobium sp. 146]